MRFQIEHNKAARNSTRTIGQLRRTHLVTNYGPGSLVDLPNYSVIMGACDYWEDPVPVADVRLQRLLGVKALKSPQPSDDLNSQHGVVKAFRFPYWCYCPRCHSLGPYWQLAGDKAQLKCSKCKITLIPSRFVAACEHGHIQDFPYDWWVHLGHRCSARSEGKRPNLEIDFSSTTGSLEGIQIRCRDCGAVRTMANCTSRGALGGFRCFGHRPWISDYHEGEDPLGCGLPMQGLNRGASNIYYRVTASALTIPTHESKVVTANWDVINGLMSSELDETGIRAALVGILGGQIRKSGLTVGDILREARQRTSTCSTAMTNKDLFEQEYHALTAPNTNARDFKTIHVGVPDVFSRYIEDVVLVPRLREVMALRGFRRIYPEPDDEDAVDIPESEAQQGYDCTPPYASDNSWLPAMELLGEGIFIQLRRDVIDEWTGRIGSRYTLMQRRLSQSNMRCQNFSPAFVLLHTLAHILIRQLTTDCGYSGSSLKERIYSTWHGSEQDMCGILVYTSSTDSDGSMGGLVRQGLPTRLDSVIRDALANASWCSSDPVCSESMAQGYDSLNYAACYACTLLPETSCSMRNCLLDRVSLVGTPEHPELGFFNELMDTQDVL